MQLCEVQPCYFFSVDSANSWTWSITPCSHTGGAAQMLVRRLLFAKIWLLQSDDIWHFVSLWRYSPLQEFIHSFQETVVNILDTVDIELSRDPQSCEFVLCLVWTTMLFLLAWIRRRVGVDSTCTCSLLGSSGVHISTRTPSNLRCYSVISCCNSWCTNIPVIDAQHQD